MVTIKYAPTTKKEKIEQAYRLGSMWKHYANLAGERGDKEMQERHYARAQKWLDILNELEGYNDN